MTLFANAKPLGEVLRLWDAAFAFGAALERAVALRAAHDAQGQHLQREKGLQVR